MPARCISASSGQTQKMIYIRTGVLYATGVLKGSLVDANGKRLGTEPAVLDRGPA